MKKENINKMKLWKSIIEQEVCKYIEIKENYQKTIYEAMNYSVYAGGKRIRPVLMLAVYELFNKDCKDYKDILPYVCAIEMIHTYSLVHDDLPAMDDDDLRRGKKTNHKVFGEAIAILAGDALLNKAYEIMYDDIILKQDHDRFIRAASYISHAAGEEGMIAGQVVDIQSEGKKIDKETLDYMYNSKTGCLLKASILAPAYISKANNTELEALSKYAECIGLAFQIKDDILDYCGDEQVFGKTVGSDVNNNKSTYVSILGLEKAKEVLKEKIDSAIKSLSIFNEKADFLMDLAQYIMNREK